MKANLPFQSNYSKRGCTSSDLLPIVGRISAERARRLANSAIYLRMRHREQKTCQCKAGLAKEVRIHLHPTGNSNLVHWLDLPAFYAFRGAGRIQQII
jgi:hypothetical protein